MSVSLRGRLFALVTFPGISCRDVVDRLLAALLKEPLHIIDQQDALGSWVTRSLPQSQKKRFARVFGSFLPMSLIALFVGGASAFRLEEFADSLTYLDKIFLWVAVSIGCHAFWMPEDIAVLGLPTDGWLLKFLHQTPKVRLLYGGLFLKLPVWIAALFVI